ncbi:MAG: hypothetical protein JXQ84_06210, partial [Rhodospirillaceae bacterium]|nr:hypothetical protein [Rhodospirillaceae bacterium]
MKRIIRAFCVVACLVAGVSMGHAATPVRIVSLSGSLTEIVVHLGFGDQLVGVDRSSLRPPDVVRRLPRVGSPRAVSIESV